MNDRAGASRIAWGTSGPFVGRPRWAPAWPRPPLQNDAIFARASVSMLPAPWAVPPAGAPCAPSIVRRARFGSRSRTTNSRSLQKPRETTKRNLPQPEFAVTPFARVMPPPMRRGHQGFEQPSEGVEASSSPEVRRARGGRPPWAAGLLWQPLPPGLILHAVLLQICSKECDY